VGAPASTGARSGTVTTGGEAATLASAFNVTSGAPTVSGASPVSAHQNDSNVNVTITGQFTHFVQGTTTANFGSADTAVNSLTVNGATSAVANITISASAATGPRTVTMTTGSETATGVGVFTVLAGTPQI